MRFDSLQGLFYFLDVLDLCPTQLEWNMKLWWPHNEAMIALLMTFQHSSDEAHLRLFEVVHEYSSKHVRIRISSCGKFLRMSTDPS